MFGNIDRNKGYLFSSIALQDILGEKGGNSARK